MQDPKNRQKFAIWRHYTTLSGYIFATKAHIDNRKKLLNSNTSPTCPHNMVHFGPLMAGLGWRVWGTPANFSVFHVLPSLLQRHRSLEANQTLHDVWPSPARVHYIHFRGQEPPDRILPGAKFTLCPSVVFAYIGSITDVTRAVGVSQWHFAALSRGRHLYSEGRPSHWASAHILVFFHFLGRIARTTYVDAVYCYRLSSVVWRSVCHTSEPCKNGWTDWDAIWVEDFGGPREPGNFEVGQDASHCKV